MTGDGVERRPGAAPRRHRRRDGPVGDRCGARGGHHDPHRRRLRDGRRGRGGGPARLPERPPVRALHLRPRAARGRAVPRLRPLGRRGAPAADRHADPGDRPGNRDAPGPRPGARAGGARRHGAAAPAARAAARRPRPAGPRLGRDGAGVGRAGHGRVPLRAARRRDGRPAIRGARARRCTRPTCRPPRSRSSASWRARSAPPWPPARSASRSRASASSPTTCCCGASRSRSGSRPPWS